MSSSELTQIFSLKISTRQRIPPILVLKNGVKMSDGSLVKGNVPKTHFFAPNSVTPNPKLTRPPKDTSRA